MKVGISISLEVDVINALDKKVLETNSKVGVLKTSRSLYVEKLILTDLQKKDEVKPEKKK